MKPIEDKKNLGKYISKVRKKKKLRQKDVADALGISRSLYAQIESGVAFPGFYLDELINLLGEEIAEYFEYNINYYTNHRLLIYTLIFDVSFKDVAKAFGLNINQIRKMVFSKRKKYIIQYKDEIEKLFPYMHTIQDYGEIKIIGNNSISIIVGGKCYIFPNMARKRKERDTIFSLIYSK